MKAVVFDPSGVVVQNILAWIDGLPIPPGMNIKLFADDVFVNPGWHYVNGQFVNPNPPPPPVVEKVTTVSSAQGMLALLDAGLLDTVTAFVDNSTDKALKIWFYRANTWERNNPYIGAVATQLGLTDQQIDDLFRSAATK